MKLTNYMRDAFIRAVMDDVPTEDFQEQARSLVTAHFAKLRKAAFPRGDIDKLVEVGWLHKNHYAMPSGMGSVSDIGPNDYKFLTKDATLWGALEVLSAKNLAQSKHIQDLQSRLRSVAYSCTTRKALAAALPEFEKYMPADQPDAIRTLPAVANVVTDFVKAGWPKGERPTTTAA